MENCQICNREIPIGSPCVCQEENSLHPELDMLLTILDVMDYKVKLYKETMQNRLFMIKEDIMASVNEEITKYHQFLLKSMNTLENFIDLLQNSEDEENIPDELLNVIPSIKPIKFSLNSTEIQEEFARALAGEHVYFRESIRAKSSS
ncbi:unnamed protein product [Blepharisma stoltei]|uniref:Uncharacterized protein n=1 Tax=Blepharisma stoltei TaxID=1481888 RepID=A0AAU9JE33_9CILI|nr:unnamed protein product [Blepharisma stoltei]